MTERRPSARRSTRSIDPMSRTLRPRAYSTSTGGWPPRAEAERELGRDRVGPVVGAVFAVVVEVDVELGVELAAGPGPEEAPACEPPRLDVVARSAQDLVQPLTMLGRPRPPYAGDAVELLQERVERRVHDVALVECRKLDELLGPLDRPHVQQVRARSTRAGTSPRSRGGLPKSRSRATTGSSR